MALSDYINQNPEGVQDNPITEPVTTPITTPVTTPVAPVEPAAPVADKPIETTPVVEEIDINGTKVPLSEVRQGYLRQSDLIV